MTNDDIIDKVKGEVLETYPQDGINIVIPAQKNYSFQLTSTSNEMKSFNNYELTGNANRMSIINLDECESLLNNNMKFQKMFLWLF